MYLKYKVFAENKKYSYEIGEFKYAWYSNDDKCLIIGIRKMEDIYLPISIEESNFLINKLFAAFKNNSFVELTGLCFAESYVDEYLAVFDEDGNIVDEEMQTHDEETCELLPGYDVQTDQEKFLDFVREERRYTPEAYDIKISDE